MEKMSHLGLLTTLLVLAFTISYSFAMPPSNLDVTHSDATTLPEYVTIVTAASTDDTTGTTTFFDPFATTIDGTVTATDDGTTTTTTATTTTTKGVVSIDCNLFNSSSLREACVQVQQRCMDIHLKCRQSCGIDHPANLLMSSCEVEVILKNTDEDLRRMDCGTCGNKSIARNVLNKHAWNKNLAIRRHRRNLTELETEGRDDKDKAAKIFAGKMTSYAASKFLECDEVLQGEDENLSQKRSVCHEIAAVCAEYTGRCTRKCDAINQEDIEGIMCEPFSFISKKSSYCECTMNRENYKGNLDDEKLRDSKYNPPPLATTSE